MARKKAQKPKEVIVRVRVSADGKPKRRRRAPAKKKLTSAGDLARVGRTDVQFTSRYYPQPAPASVMDSVIPAQFRQQAPTAGLLEDVKRERTNLLKDIEKQTEQQIVQYVAKQQGAEQRAELEKEGAFDPFNTSEYASKTPPSLVAMPKPSRPLIEEIDEGVYTAPFQDVPFIENIAPKPQMKVISKKKLVVKERPPVPIFTEPKAEVPVYEQSRPPSFTEMFVRSPIVDSEADTEQEGEVSIRLGRRPRSSEEEKALLEKSKAKALQAGLPDRIEPRLGKIQREDKKQLAQAIYNAQQRGGIVITGADIQRLYGIKPQSVMSLVRKIEKGESLD